MSAPGVLILDDDVGAALALAQALERRGFAARVTHTPEEAIEAARDPAIALALLDIRLRGMSGIAVLLQLRELRPELPVVMMSSDTDPATVSESLAGGARAFLAKPLDLHALMQYVDEFTGRSAPRAC